MDIDSLTIGDIKNIAAMFPAIMAHDSATMTLDSFAVGQTVIIRTYSAGVWFGTLKQKSKNEVILIEARRMWWWHCKESISLSGVVAYGINRDKSKIAPPVPYVWLEAIEIMPITGDAAKSIMEADIVQAV